MSFHRRLFTAKVSLCRSSSKEFSSPFEQRLGATVPRLSSQVADLALFLQGIAFEQAENGKQAVDLFMAAHDNGRPFHLFCTDVQMPIMDGLEAAHAVRAYEREQSLPRCKLIALTGLSNEEDIRTAESSLDYWVVKGGKSMRIILEEIGRLQQDLDSAHV